MLRTAMRSIVALAFLGGPVLGAQPALPPWELLTVAEKSDWKATARHAEVVVLLDALAKASPLARRAEMGTTTEGRSLPMLIVADPPVSNADEARAAAAGGKLVVLMIGNIHAGEVDGKEALPILARELLGLSASGPGTSAPGTTALRADPTPSSSASSSTPPPPDPAPAPAGSEARPTKGEVGSENRSTTEPSPMLKDLVLVFVPIYNADGNEKVAKTNRPGQIGPEEGMGVRENAAGLDLNRDFIKLEAPETRALVKAFNDYDPHIFIDTHTTNGSFHQYVITYSGPKNPAGDAKIVEYVRDTMLPRIGSQMLEKHARKTFVYGDFDENHTKWATYPPTPRYGTSYVGIRNRISILSEGYSYAPYRDRVLGTRDFVLEILNDAAANKEAIRTLIADADRAATAEVKPEDVIPLRTKSKPAPGRVTAAGFVEEQKDGKTVSTGQPKDYEVEVWNHYEPTLTVPKPFAYLLPPGPSPVTDLLQRHGVRVEELREDIELDIEAYTVDSMARSPQPFQGHSLATVDATVNTMSRRVPAGTVIVRTAQKLGPLAAYMLEPEAEDGLTAWNFFDADLKLGGEFPVLRLPKGTPILTGAIRPLRDTPAPKKTITFKEFFESDQAPNFSGSPTSIVGWLDDGEHFLQDKDGKLRRVNATTGRSEVYFDSAPLGKALAALPTIGDKAADSLASQAVWRMNKARTAAVFNHENDLYWAAADGSKAVRLTSTPQTEELVEFSPSGEFVAFVRANNLYVVDVQTQTERQLTTTGNDHTLNGKADWVYFEEIFNRNWKTYWWSPDSAAIAFYETDNSPVPVFTVVDSTTTSPRVETTKYPKVGEPNPRVRLGFASVGGTVGFTDLSAYNADDMLISNVGWRPDGSGVIFYVQDRVQSWADVMAVGARGGAPAKLFRETTKAWVEPPAPPTFLKDGSFLFASERTGWKHFYHYAKGGALVRPLTEGEWEARELEVVDEEAGWLYFSGTKDSHIAGNLYRVKLDGSSLQRLTTEPGSHRTTVAPKGGMFVDTWSSRAGPAKVAVRDADGSLRRTLDSNPVYTLDEYQFGPSEQFQIPMPDGFLVEAAWTKPVNFDPARKYPVWFTTYGGPHAPTISDSWGNGGTWDQALANAGFIVFRADPRPASGKGAQSAWVSYKQLGVQECQDISDAITWLKSHPWVDGTRIGMSGFSFGGYITAYCMTQTDHFAAGIAGGPVTDWREYDSIYTERYMLTPQDNPEGYDKTSVIKAAKNLKGRLMLLHGAIDDNVHLSNTWKLAKALQDNDKQFEMMIYPAHRHGVWGKQYQRWQYDFITKTLGGGASESTPPAHALPVGP